MKEYLNRICPSCGGDVITLLSNGSEMCERCHFILPKCNYGYRITTGDPPAGEAIGSTSMQPCTLTVINCEKFKIQLGELEVELELEPNKLENIDTLIINGYKYVKKK